MDIVPRSTRTRNTQQPLKSARQHRVRYIREGWLRPRTRVYWKLQDAERFLDTITGDGRPDLNKLAFAVLEVRDVALGPWREVAL